MLSACIAELFRLHAIAMLFFVLRRGVIPVLAIIALQGDDFAHPLRPLLITR
jgi:non-ribosomal peptide synthetase component E (peptide arylation enzyme)